MDQNDPQSAFDKGDVTPFKVPAQAPMQPAAEQAASQPAPIDPQVGETSPLAHPVVEPTRPANEPMTSATAKPEEKPVLPTQPVPAPAVPPAPSPFQQGKSTAGENPFKRGQDASRRKRLIGIIGGGVVLILGLIYYFYIASRGGILILEPKPDFTVTLNDRPATLKQDPRGILIPAYAGVYRLKITKPNYQPFVQDITIGRGETVSIRPIFGLLGEEEKDTASTVDYVRPSLDQKSIFYLGNNRQTIYRMEVTNKVQVSLTNRPLQNVRDIQWSTDTDVSLIVQSDGVYLQEIPKYDFQSQTVVKIGGTEVNSPVWDPTNPDRMAFIYTPPSGERSLVFSDRRIQKIDRKNADLTGITNPKLIWSGDAKYILLVGRSSGDTSQNNLWIYNLGDGTLNQLTEKGNILDASFSPNNDTIVYETYSSDQSNPLGSTLSVMGVDGNNRKALNIAGNVARAAWKDNTSFYLPEADKGSLVLYTTDGKRQSIPFSFPDGGIQGMYYFPSNTTLIFYTNNAIYAANLAV